MDYLGEGDKFASFSVSTLHRRPYTIGLYIDQISLHTGLQEIIPQELLYSLYVFQ